MALFSKNKLGFVVRSIKKPNLSDPFLSPWEGINAMVLSWIFQSLYPCRWIMLQWFGKILSSGYLIEGLTCHTF